MKNILLNIIYFFSYYIGVNQLFYFITRNRQRVITFHNVIPNHLFDHSIHLGVSCSDEIFEFQLKEIEKRFNITTKIGVPSSCMITFDDGYSNKYECTHHILKKYSHKAVFFITADLVQKKELLWVDKLLMYFSYLPDGKYRFCEEEFVIDSENREDSYRKAYQFIVSSYHVKDKFINQLNEYSSLLNINSELNKLRFHALNDSQIEKMRSYGHLMACHSSSHDIFSQLKTTELEEEINKCEKLKGTLYNCDYFSYPFGSDLEVNQKVINRMRTSGFNYCFINKWLFNTNDDHHQIQRMSLPNTKNKYLINAYLSGFYYFLRKFIND